MSLPHPWSSSERFTIKGLQFSVWQSGLRPVPHWSIPVYRELLHWYIRSFRKANKLSGTKPVPSRTRQSRSCIGAYHPIYPGWHTGKLLNQPINTACTMPHWACSIANLVFYAEVWKAIQHKSTCKYQVLHRLVRVLLLDANKIDVEWLLYKEKSIIYISYWHLRTANYHSYFIISTDQMQQVLNSK